MCIPKGDKPREYIKNWRPISLLNVVYKIGSACIANRLKPVLPSLINDDQTGFMKNRYIGDNVRLIYDIIDHLQRVKKPGLLLCLDFEKAFDSLSWEFMLKVLEAFGCGPDFCKWIKTFYADIKSTVMVNGNVTSWFHVQRGCRQGDPISCYLFIMCVEILAIMIRQDNEIKGVVIGNTENKISQYADDTELTLEGDEKSFTKAIDTIKVFGKVSGLKLNTEKSCAIWLGNKKNSKTVYMPHLHMEWNPLKFKILGIWFTNDLLECVKINFEEKFLEIQMLYKIWLRRQLTPLGRVAVLKSLILSKIIYLWMLLPNPPDSTVNAIQKGFFEFVWGRKNDKIARKTSVKNIVNGGIGIPDVRNYIIALKLMWIRKLNSSQHKWTEIIRLKCNKVKLLDKLGSSLCYGNNINMFWCDVFKSYHAVGRKVKLEDAEEIVSEPLFCSNNILIGGSPFFYSEWLKKNVNTVGHLLNENGIFLTHVDFCARYGIVTDFLTYLGCVNAVKRYVSACGLHIANNVVQYQMSKVLRLICSVVRGAKVMYDVLTCDEVLPNCCKKWDEKTSKRVDWKIIFKKVHCINDVKLKWLQIRILHRILGTNVTTMCMGIDANSDCTFCNNERENVQHLFWYCPILQNFWKEFEDAINQKCFHANKFHLNEHVVIFGCDKNFGTDKIFDLFLMLAKSYIYKCKMAKELPLFQVFVLILRNRYKTEKYIANVNMKYDVFVRAWMPYTPLL